MKDKDTRETFTDEECEKLLRGYLSNALFDAGLICRADDRGDPVLQISPPLVAAQKEFDEIAGILGDVLDRGRPAHALTCRLSMSSVLDIDRVKLALHRRRRVGLRQAVAFAVHATRGGRGVSEQAQQNGAVVAARDVTRRYGEGDTAVDALRGVTVDIAPGKSTAVMGPSGSGKSTLMHILAGLDKPTSGSVGIAGTEITTLGDNDLTKLRREHIGFVFQFFNLLPMLTRRRTSSCR